MWEKFSLKKNTNPLGYQKVALLLIILLLLLTFGCIIWIAAGANSIHSSFLYADIYQNGQLKQSIDLTTVTEPFTFTIYGEGEHTNTIEVRPGSIGILSADCPDKLCVNQGFISTSQIPITCLPNRLVIQIRLENSDTSSSKPMEEHNITPDIITY